MTTTVTIMAIVFNQRAGITSFFKKRTTNIVIINRIPTTALSLINGTPASAIAKTKEIMVRVLIVVSCSITQ